MPLEERFGASQPLRGYQDEAAPTQHERASPSAPHPVADLVADHGPKDAEHYGIPQVEVSALDQDAGGARAWGRSSSAGLTEDPEQRLAGEAQAVVDLPAAAVWLHQPGYLEPREVGRDRPGGEVELPGEPGRGARGGEEALQHGRSSLAQGRLKRRPALRRARARPQVRHPAGAVGERRSVTRLDEDLHAGPGEGAGHERYAAASGLDDRLEGLLQLQGAPGVVRHGVQAGEERLDAAHGKRLPAPDRVPFQVLADPGPVGGDRQLVIAYERVYQAAQGAFRILQVYLQQTLFFAREAEQLLLVAHEQLYLFEDDLRRRGPQALELLPEGGDGGVWRGGQEVRAAPLHAHGRDQRGEVGARQDSPRPCGPGRVHRLAPLV